MTQSFDTIAEAYDRNADKYDLFIEGNPNLTRMRQKVYEHITKRVPRGARILDLACGTGTDAVWLAQHGYYVHGVDISRSMLERAEAKRLELGLQDKLEFEQRSYTELSEIASEPFACTISNFGGLNCVSNLSVVTAQVRPLLKRGGLVIWGLMPPFCLWESSMLLRGRFKLATRRFSGRSTVHKEGLDYPVYYYTPKKVVAAWGRDFSLEDITALSVITPPATNKDFAVKRPRVFELLSWLDDHLAHRWPFKYWGDFTIVTLRHRPLSE
jgi:ubiquinone/menaquinone biosynthesis C-methylase UbiE